MNCPECNGPVTHEGDAAFERPDANGDTTKGVGPVYECAPCGLSYTVISHDKPLV